MHTLSMLPMSPLQTRKCAGFCQLHFAEGLCGDFHLADASAFHFHLKGFGDHSLTLDLCLLDVSEEESNGPTTV